jgi:ribosome-binding protein aMBF1 (putative translation factor)
MNYKIEYFNSKIKDRICKWPRGILANYWRITDLMEKRILKMKYEPVSHKEFKKEVQNRADVVKAYEELEEEYALIEKIVRARKIAGLTQKQVAEKMHTTQSAISRIEGGVGKNEHSPTIATLKKYAKALGCKLSLNFVPENIKSA